jgi:hypothetical protein
VAGYFTLIMSWNIDIYECLWTFYSTFWGLALPSIGCLKC